jgi:hypothetical protein
LCFYFFGLKVKKLADKEKFYTMPDFLLLPEGQNRRLPGHHCHHHHHVWMGGAEFHRRSQTGL